MRIDLYDSSGDYEASGIDGLEMHIHGNAQDQLGQISSVGGKKRKKWVADDRIGKSFRVIIGEPQAAPIVARAVRPARPGARARPRG